MERTPSPRVLMPAIAACAVLAAGDAAALHRCTTPEGKVTYTEFPCETGSKKSGVEIHDSSGMDVNKRTNNFSYTPPPSRTPSSSSRTSTPARSTNTRTTRTRETGGDVYIDKGEYKSKSGQTLERPPTMRLLEKGQDKATEQRRLDREWEDYNKQQRELREKHGSQPLK